MDHVHLQSLHREVREELVRVDAKIGVLLRAFLITLSVVVAGLVAGDWNPAGELRSTAEFTWWMGVTVAGFSILLLIYTLNPVTTHTEAPSVGAPRYFGDLRQFSNKEAFQEAMEQTTGDTNVDRLIDQTFELSRLVSRKYTAVHWSSALYVLGLLLAGVAATLG